MKKKWVKVRKSKRLYAFCLLFFFFCCKSNSDSKHGDTSPIYPRGTSNSGISQTAPTTPIETANDVNQSPNLVLRTTPEGEGIIGIHAGGDGSTYTPPVQNGVLIETTDATIFIPGPRQADTSISTTAPSSAPDTTAAAPSSAPDTNAAAPSSAPDTNAIVGGVIGGIVGAGLLTTLVVKWKNVAVALGKSGIAGKILMLKSGVNGPSNQLYIDKQAELSARNAGIARNGASIITNVHSVGGNNIFLSIAPTDENIGDLLKASGIPSLVDSGYEKKISVLSTVSFEERVITNKLFYLPPGEKTDFLLRDIPEANRINDPATGNPAAGGKVQYVLNKGEIVGYYFEKGNRLYGPDGKTILKNGELRYYVHGDGVVYSQPQNLKPIEVWKGELGGYYDTEGKLVVKDTKGLVGITPITRPVLESALAGFNYKLGEWGLIDVRDYGAIHLDELHEGADFIHAQVQTGDVLVHCKTGSGRSASEIVAYFMKYENMSLEQAIKKLQESGRIVSVGKGINNGKGDAWLEGFTSLNAHGKQLKYFEKDLTLLKTETDPAILAKKRLGNLTESLQSVAQNSPALREQSIPEGIDTSPRLLNSGLRGELSAMQLKTQAKSVLGRGLTTIKTEVNETVLEGLLKGAAKIK